MTTLDSLPFHPVVSEWFSETFGEPTDVQLQAWSAAVGGRHTLIAAPTGSGKTLAALLPCLDKLVRAKLEKSDEAGANAGWQPGVRVLYITPLRALNNDIHHHVARFTEELDERATRSGQPWPGIRCAVRTGDTSPSARASMLKRPPDVLVTTPESLYILLTSHKGSAMLGTVQHVIVDEIHDMAADKRGSHLSLSLERLEWVCGRPVQRIGVSATQKPVERVARFLGGWEPSGEREGAEHPLGYFPRAITVVESAMEKALGVSVTMPDSSRTASSREQVWLPLLDRIVELMEGSRSVLLFVGSRRLCERLCLRLNEHVGYELSRTHHGSMSRERRLEVERLLKTGELRCIVATSSLELGIDVGHVDLVIQIDSPNSAASGIQRIGRAGHAVGETSRGIILSRQKGNLPEIAVLSRQIAARDIEEIRIPRQAMDVLSQQIVAMAAMNDWTVDELYDLIARSDSYFDFARGRLEELLRVLSGFYPFARPLLEWDSGEGTVRRKGGASAMAAIVGAGTIPQSGGYPVHHLDSRAHLGELDEEFIQESRVGDVFQLGTSSWMIRDIRKDRVYVSEAGNRFSEVPFWRNESGARSYELGLRIGAFLREMTERLASGHSTAEDNARSVEEEIGCFLAERYGMDAESAGQLVGTIRSQSRASEVPTDRRVVIETYKDLTNQTHVIVLNHFGRRVNRAWQLAIERQFEQLLPYRMYGNAKDDGIEFVLPEWDASWLRTIGQVTPSNVESLLTEAITGSPLLAIAFRRIAETSLLLSRSFTRTPLWQQRLRSEELLRDAMPYAERFPYLQEAMKVCLYEYLDCERLKQVLEHIRDGEIEIVVRETGHPSPFASKFLADYVNMRIYEGDGIDETLKLQLMSVSKELTQQLFGADSGRSAVPSTIVEEESRRLAEPDRALERAEDLAPLLKRRGDMTAAEISRLAGASAPEWLELMCERGRLAALDIAGNGELRWICADEKELYAHFPHSADAVSFIVGRYVDNRLSFTEPELCERYPDLSLAEAKRIADEWVAQDRLQRSPHAADEQERIWTSSKIASRLIRLSVGHARRQTEPVDPIRWCGHIALLQHALQGSQQQGSDGLRTVIASLQGLFAPLSQWETLLFPARMSAYRKEDLDLLCGSGEVIWIGRKEEGDKEGKVAFFLAESRELLAPFIQAVHKTDAPTKHPGLLRKLKEEGASFLTKLSREEGRPPSELLADLLDLVWEGRASNDQFAPLRLSLNAKGGKSASKSGSGFGRWYWTGELGESVVPSGSDRRGQEDVLGRSAVQWAGHLMKSFGMINKELVAKLTPFSWDAIYPALIRLEEWGTLTRGAYLRGEASLQFATKESADSMRQPLPGLGQDAITVLSSVDPANPYGLAADWPDAGHKEKYARKPGNYLVLCGGRWLYWIENNGKRIFRVAEDEASSENAELSGAALLKKMLYIVLHRQKKAKIVIDEWNGSPVLETDAGKQLQQLGAERDMKSLVFWTH